MLLMKKRTIQQYFQATLNQIIKALSDFAQAIMRELRLFGCYDILFGKVREFVQNNMFDSPVNLSDLNTLRNLSEVEYIRLIKDSFKKP